MHCLHTKVDNCTLSNVNCRTSSISPLHISTCANLWLLQDPVHDYSIIIQDNRNSSNQGRLLNSLADGIEAFIPSAISNACHHFSGVAHGSKLIPAARGSKLTPARGSDITQAKPPMKILHTHSVPRNQCPPTMVASLHPRPIGSVCHSFQGWHAAATNKTKHQNVKALHCQTWSTKLYCSTYQQLFAAMHNPPSDLCSAAVRAARDSHEHLRPTRRRRCLRN